MKNILKKYRILSVLLICLLSTQITSAQRSLGLFVDTHVLSLENASANPVNALAFGISLKKWRTDKKFVRTSISKMSYSDTYKTGSNYVLTDEIKSSTDLINFQFEWSKIIGESEADDPFIFYHNLGFGLLMNKYTKTKTSLVDGTVTENWDGENFTHYLPSVIAGLGFEFRVYPRVYVNTELTFQGNEAIMGLVPRFTATYRLY